MLEFVAASKAESTAKNVVETAEMIEKRSLKVQKRALHQEEAQLRNQRRTVRQQRIQEGTAWKKIKAERRQEKTGYSKLPSAKRKVLDERWQVLRQQRRETKKQRQAEDDDWRKQRLDFKERWGQLPIITTWVAILVITDNCTRQCPGLPLFVAGSKVTSEMIVESLRTLLPPELQFIITDRGTHFTANLFEQFAGDE